jgi:hypothetical protein
VESCYLLNSLYRRDRGRTAEGRGASFAFFQGPGCKKSALHLGWTSTCPKTTLYLVLDKVQD